MPGVHDKQANFTAEAAFQNFVDWLPVDSGTLHADKEVGTPPIDAEAAAALTKLLSDPSMAALIKNLAKSL